MIRFRSSLAFRLNIVTLLAITLVLAAGNWYAVSRTRAYVEGLITDEALTQAAAAASRVTNHIVHAKTTAASIKTLTEDALAQGTFDRTSLTNQLKSLLAQDAFYFGTWIQEEPDAFDGKSASFRADVASGSTPSGLYQPYWTRGQDGKFSLAGSEGDYQAAYYVEPKAAGGGVLIEPYSEPQANNATMSSVAYPIMKDGRFAGVAGVDFLLTTLSQQLAETRVLDAGNVYLVSQKGRWLVAPDAASRMKDYGANDRQAIMDALQTGSSSVAIDIQGASGGRVLKIYYPFDVEDLKARWLILIELPMTTVRSAMDSQTRMMIWSGLLTLLAALTCLYLALNRFALRPLASLLEDVALLSRGNYEGSVASRDRKDEIGAVAQALEGLREDLLKSRRLAAKAEMDRERADLERERNEVRMVIAGETAMQVVAVLGNGLSELSQGNLSYRIEEEFTGHYSGLKEDYNQALFSLEESIHSLQETALGITAEVERMHESAERLSGRTERQAHSLQETLTSMQNMSRQVHATSQSAREVAAMVERACARAEQSRDIVQKATRSMEGISESAGRVSQIIGVIDEIAFQTNLLALNAGVEAARAGESGRGFAVVAQEVRALAQRSAQAAKEIKTLITESGEEVRLGVSYVDQTGDALADIASQIEDINRIARQISTSASEQTAGLAGVSSAMADMDQVTQENAAMVQDTSAATVELAARTSRLSHIVSRFLVRGQPTASPDLPDAAAIPKSRRRA